jgi:hypothetical protein
MKKLFFVLALVVAYGLSITNSTAKIVKTEKAGVVLTVASDDNSTTIVEKEKKEKKETTTKKATVKEEKGCAAGCAGCPEGEKKACAESKKAGETKACCEGEKKVEKK